MQRVKRAYAKKKGIILMMRFINLLIISLFLFRPAPAFNAANPYWMNLKPKLVKYLDKAINKSIYKYELIGPNKEMKSFLGNRPDANVQFENLMLESPSPHKSLVAVVYDDSGNKADSLVISFNLWVYKKVYMLHKSISARDDITEDNIYQAVIPIRQMDTNLYYDGNLKQKVATTNIAAGTPLKVNMVRHEKLVQIGDVINIKSGNQFITLEFMCKAMNSGDIGDTITVNCQDMQNKTMKASITGPGSAVLI